VQATGPFERDRGEVPRGREELQTVAARYAAFFQGRAFERGVDRCPFRADGRRARGTARLIGFAEEAGASLNMIVPEPVPLIGDLALVFAVPVPVTLVHSIVRFAKPWSGGSLRIAAVAFVVSAVVPLLVRVIAVTVVGNCTWPKDMPPFCRSGRR
jgi:hypothetical protein